MLNPIFFGIVLLDLVGYTQYFSDCQSFTVRPCASALLLDIFLTYNHVGYPTSDSRNPTSSDSSAGLNAGYPTSDLTCYVDDAESDLWISGVGYTMLH